MFFLATRSLVLGIALLVLVGCREETRLRMKANRGDTEAMRLLSMKLRKHGTYADNGEGIRWLTKAADKGDTDAMHSLGRIYDSPNGESIGAYTWYRKGAEAGDPRCMVRVGDAYRFGQFGLRENHEEAKKWYDKAEAINIQRMGIR